MSLQRIAFPLPPLEKRTIPRWFAFGKRVGIQSNDYQTLSCDYIRFSLFLSCVYLSAVFCFIYLSVFILKIDFRLGFIHVDGNSGKIIDEFLVEYEKYVASFCIFMLTPYYIIYWWKRHNKKEILKIKKDMHAVIKSKNISPNSFKFYLGVTLLISLILGVIYNSFYLFKLDDVIDNRSITLTYLIFCCLVLSIIVSHTVSYLWITIIQYISAYIIKK